MGKVEKFVKKREAETHKTTDEFIDTLRWYIAACAKLDKQFVEEKNNLTEAFNAKLREIREAQK